MSEGLSGTTPLLYIVSIVVFIGISKSRFHYLYISITIANILVLYFLEQRYSDQLLVHYSTEVLRETDLFFGLIAGVVLCFSLIRHFKIRYNSERNTLEKQREELKELNATKDKFFSIISHDLRSPFNSIIGLSELMASDEESISINELRNYAELTRESASNAYSLLENLLTWARINQGVFPFKPELINIKPIVQKSIETQSNDIASKNINIENNVKDDITVVADKNMLLSVFRNLLSNAIKFSNNNNAITISLNKPNNKDVSVSIIDNGIGMSEKMVNNIFLIDVNTGRPGTMGEPSAGLGLLLCKEFVTIMGGEIWIESKENSGSNFTFSLPVKTDEIITEL